MNQNKKSTIYDWPTRIFHWLFAFLFLAAYLIAESVSDESPLFVLHIAAGLTIGFILILRIVWGFTGTTYARFSSFIVNPVELLQYLKDVLTAKTRKYAGHNPASGYAAIMMFICAGGLVVTGLLMTGGSENDVYEETHELLATLFLIAVIAHIGGVIFHHVRHRDSLWSSMFDGKKEIPAEETGIINSKRWAGILFLAFTLLWTGYIYSQYDHTTRKLDLFGKQLILSEQEHESDYEGEAYEDD